MSATLRNVRAVARREFTVRIRTRSFVFGTLFLAVAGLALALAPIGIRWLEGESTASIGVVNRAADPPLTFDPATRLAVLLNASAADDQAGYTVEAIADDATARAAVEGGELEAALLVSRGARADLTFVVVSKSLEFQRLPELLRQASVSFAVADRLDRLGVAPGDQAGLFAPPEVKVELPAPTGPGEPATAAEFAATALVGQALVIFLFMAILLYGQWVATSVAEEKSSRVMEIVLSAATPFQLLGGKVIGVGGLGMVQLGAAVVPALIGFLLQGRIAELLLGAPASELALPEVLTPAVLAAFAVFFVLGYLLYATLYAAAGSLVSRMEDVNNVVAPMSLISVAGYLIAAYASIGIVAADATWVVVLSFVPFVSPYLMLSRFIAGQAAPLEVLVAIAIVAVAAVVMLWLAARVYAAGVLMYGQQAGFRKLLVAALGRSR